MGFRRVRSDLRNGPLKRIKSDLRVTATDLRNHQAIVQPRSYDCLMVTQIALKTEGPHGLPVAACPSWEGWTYWTLLAVLVQLVLLVELVVLVTARPPTSPVGPTTRSASPFFWKVFFKIRAQPLTAHDALLCHKY